MTIQIDFKAPFDEQVAFWKGKAANIPTHTWKDVWQEAHDKAFMVAGVTNAELLRDIKSLMTKAIENGTPYKTFVKDFKKIAENRGWAAWDNYSNKKKAWRLNTIYNTNFRTSYAAGRYQQLQAMPFWRYRHSDFVLRPRQNHLALDGLCLPKDDPFWDTHFPPNGWGCRCYVEGELVQKGDYEEMKGIAAGAPAPAEGWNYAPGKNTMETFGALCGRELLLAEPLIGASLGQAIVARFKGRATPTMALSETSLQKAASAVGREIEAAVDDVAAVQKGQAAYNTKKVSVVGAFSTKEIEILKTRGIHLNNAAILMTNEALAHATREYKSKKQKALPQSVYKNLMAHLAGADLYWDKENANFVFVFESEELPKGSVAKIIVGQMQKKILSHGKSLSIRSNFLITGGVDNLKSLLNMRTKKGEMRFEAIQQTMQGIEP